MTLKEPISVSAVAEMLLLLHLSRSAASQLDSTRDNQADRTMRTKAMPIRTFGVGPHTPISTN